jgi:hypothetical protein
MFERLSQWREKLGAWWRDFDRETETADASLAEEAERFLVFFRPAAAEGLPQPVQQAIAAGTFSSIVALGGVALLCLAGMLLALFGIYLLVTQVLGLEIDLDPRFWRAAGG